MATKKPVTKPIIKKTPVKKPVSKPTIKKPVAKKASVEKVTNSPIIIDVNSSTKSATSMMDKAIDLIKWVDTPFKLFEVILLASVFFFGYFAWDSRSVILNAITQSSKITNLK